ncbi:hypothetical protein ABZV75_35760 [Streptomyces flaveolus]|uniref:hypothetical protein n=1 Tax=Streptomyces flaveolus TaxID=67297 RepID=UPI0033B5C662
MVVLQSGSLTDKARDLLRGTSALLARTVRRALADSMGPEQRAAMSALVPELETAAH